MTADGLCWTTDCASLAAAMQSKSDRFFHPPFSRVPLVRHRSHGTKLNQSFRCSESLGDKTKRHKSENAVIDRVLTKAAEKKTKRKRARLHCSSRCSRPVDNLPTLRASERNDDAFKRIIVCEG